MALNITGKSILAGAREASRRQTVKRCEAEAKRGTGTGMCDRPLDEHGNCDQARSHL